MATKHLRSNGRTRMAWYTRAEQREARECGYRGHSTKGARYYADESKRKTRLVKGKAHRARRDQVMARDVPLEWERSKLLDGVLVLLHAAAREGRQPSVDEIAMAIWMADWAHLGKHGRPITYRIGTEGAPVRIGDLATSLMSGDPKMLAAVGETPWTTSGSLEAGNLAFSPTREPDLWNVLSQSDVETLEAAWAETPAALREDKPARNRRDRRHHVILTDWKKCEDNILHRFGPTGLIGRPVPASPDMSAQSA